MLGGDGDRFTKAEFPGFQHAALSAAGFRLVGNHHDGLAGFAHHFGEGPVVRH